MNILSNLINLKNPYNQDFSLPKPIILYAFENAERIVLQKLIQCCKTFKLLQTYGHVEELRIWQKMHKFDIGIRRINFGGDEYVPEFGSLSYGPKIYFQFKFVKVMKILTLSDFCQTKFSFLLTKLDLSKTRVIKINMSLVLKRESFEKLLSPSLERLNVWVTSLENNFNPVLLALEKCSKMSQISFHTYSINSTIITKSIFKNILSKKRETKLKYFCIGGVSSIEHKDFLEFLDNFTEPEIYLTLNFKEENRQEYLELKDLVETLTKTRFDSGGHFPSVGLDVGEQRRRFHNINKDNRDIYFKSLEKLGKKDIPWEQIIFGTQYQSK